MKFISKYQNYRVVLKSGISGNRETGQQPIPGEFVKFERGMVDVNDETKIAKLKNHNRYGKDFVSAEDQEGGSVSTSSNFLRKTKEDEPRHKITEMQHGEPTSKNLQNKVDFGDKDKEVIKEMAKQMASEIIKDKLPEEVNKEISRREEQSKGLETASYTPEEETTGGNEDYTSYTVAEETTGGSYASEEETVTTSPDTKKPQQPKTKTKAKKSKSKTTKKKKKK